MNNRKIKSTLAVLLAAGIITLASCSSTTEPEQADPTETTTAAQEANTSEVHTMASVKLDRQVTTAAVGAAKTTVTERNTEAQGYETITTLTEIIAIADESEITTPDVEFDKVFDYRVGETHCVGRAGVLFRIDSITTDETGFTTVTYTLTIDGEEYNGEGGRFADGVISQFVQDRYTPYVTSLYYCEDADGLSYASVIITSELYRPEPLELSGNPDDLYEITEPQYVETDDMILFLCEGTVIKGDTMERLYRLIEILENESKLTFFNDSVYANLRSDKHVGEFADFFADVDYRMQKFHVYVVPAEVSIPCAWNAEVVVNPQDMDFETDSSTLIHEFAHSLHLRNGVGLGDIMTEGYATYMTDRVIKKYSEINTDFDPESNYSGFFTTLTPENAEKIFAGEQTDRFNCYLYGYRFLHFLYAEYGDDVFNDILKSASDSAGQWEYDLLLNEKAIPHIKKCTSGNVFAEFAVWLSANEEMFDGN